MEREIYINFKSGKTVKTTTDATAEQIGQKIRDNTVDINPNDLSLIRWEEVESISPVIEK